MQKRVAAINDISCFGKCSLTIALPILSAAGIETCPVPTALLSTHTGGFTGIHIHDLSEDIVPIAEHWKKLSLRFDAIYSGYLGSFTQLDYVSKTFDMLKGEDTLIVVDPVMADDGKLYSGFTDEFPAGMRELCKKADIITPNITEAALLLGEEYVSGPYTREYIEGLLKRLSSLGCRYVVLTGVYFESGSLGAAAYDSSSGSICYAMSDYIEGSYHGTGDTFTSTALAALMCGFPIGESLKIAADFVSECVLRTKTKYPEMTYGVNFEAGIPGLIERLGLREK